MQGKALAHVLLLPSWSTLSVSLPSTTKQQGSRSTLLLVLVQGSRHSQGHIP